MTREDIQNYLQMLSDYTIKSGLITRSERTRHENNELIINTRSSNVPIPVILAANDKLFVCPGSHNIDETLIKVDEIAAGEYFEERKEHYIRPHEVFLRYDIELAFLSDPFNQKIDRFNQSLKLSQDQMVQADDLIKSFTYDMTTYNHNASLDTLMLEQRSKQ